MQGESKIAALRTAWNANRSLPRVSTMAFGQVIDNADQVFKHAEAMLTQMEGWVPPLSKLEKIAEVELEMAAMDKVIAQVGVYMKHIESKVAAVSVQESKEKKSWRNDRDYIKAQIMKHHCASGLAHCSATVIQEHLVLLSSVGFARKAYSRELVADDSGMLDLGCIGLLPAQSKQPTWLHRQVSAYLGRVDVDALRTTVQPILEDIKVQKASSACCTVPMDNSFLWNPRDEHGTVTQELFDLPHEASQYGKGLMTVLRFHGYDGRVEAVPFQQFLQILLVHIGIVAVTVMSPQILQSIGGDVSAPSKQLLGPMLVDEHSFLLSAGSLHTSYYFVIAYFFIAFIAIAYYHYSQAVKQAYSEGQDDSWRLVNGVQTC